MSSEKTYLFFLPNFGIGGAGNSILKICKNLKKKNNKIIIVSLGLNHYRNKFKKLNIKLIELPYEKLLRSIPQLKKIVLNYLRDEKKVIFISNINYANVVSCVFLKRFKKFKNFKLILFERTPIQELDQYKNILSYFKNKIIKLLIKFYYKEAHHVIGNSSKVSKDLENICSRKILTYNPIVEPNKKIVKKNEIRKFLWIGRNSSEKNLDDLIKAIYFIKDLKFELTIISDFFLEKQKTEILNISQKKINLIKFENNEIKKYFKKTDVLISTSIYEGFPNVVAEAISYNCLIVTSNSFGGISDLIKNKNFGYIYNLYDSKQLSIKMKKSMEKTKNNSDKKINARKNLNLIYSKNNQLINFLLKI